MTVVLVEARVKVEGWSMELEPTVCGVVKIVRIVRTEVTILIRYYSFHLPPAPAQASTSFTPDH